MDLATIIGALLGVGLIGAAVSDGVEQFMDAPSVLIVIGGGIAATLMSLPLARFLKMPKVFMKSVFADKASNTELIDNMVRYGEIARRDGILALEGVMEEISDPFLNRGIQLAVDGNDPDVISTTLNQEMASLAERHNKGKQIFELLGKYAPAFGMIGTLIGLILMLANLDDPDQIAPNMAVALLTTLYGALLSNMLALPLADKLGERSEEELARMAIVKEGVISIQSGDNPKVVEQRLQLFLAPAEEERSVSDDNKRPIIVNEGAPAWMVTFGDLMSLLLTFFILLFSISEVKQQKIYEVFRSFRVHWKIETPTTGFHVENFSDVVNLLSEMALELPDQRFGMEGRARRDVENPFGPYAEIIRIEDNLTICLHGKVMFDEHSAQIKEEAKDVLASVQTELRGRVNRIHVIGHANPTALPSDSVYSDHDDLSYQRAKAVKEFLSADSQAGQAILPQRLHPVARGRDDIIPGIDLYDAEDRLKLDRVEIVVTKENAFKHLKHEGRPMGRPTDDARKD